MGTNIHMETPVELFKELVDSAIDQQHLKTSEDSSFYLVQLLDHFVCPTGAYVDVGTRPDHPLGPSLLAAEQADGFERFILLRSIGDLALFLTGFFYASLERRNVTADYYSRVGGTAYGRAAEVCRPRSQADIFTELAEHFVAFTLVLHDVARHCNAAERPDLLALSDTQREVGDGHSAAMLRRYGIRIGGLGEGSGQDPVH